MFAAGSSLTLNQARALRKTLPDIYSQGAQGVTARLASDGMAQHVLFHPMQKVDGGVRGAGFT